MSSLTFGQKVLRFNASLNFTSQLPKDIGIMNPFKNNQCALAATEQFYHKYYNDTKKRRIILGINPGRFGAGHTGVPFSDTKRLKQYCGIEIAACGQTHEPSSQFVYEVISAMGGPMDFYKHWYINSLCPLGFTKIGKNGKPVNYNYYDSMELTRIAEPFMLKTLREQLDFGILRNKCICFGTGKNAGYLNKLNIQHHFFEQIISLEHPRYIMQYKTAQKNDYIKKYVDALAWQD